MFTNDRDSANVIDDFIAGTVLPYIRIEDYPKNTIKNAAAFAATAANTAFTAANKAVIPLQYETNINIIKQNLLLLYRHFCKISATVLVYSK
jgi:hypothetical protein